MKISGKETSQLKIETIDICFFLTHKFKKYCKLSHLSFTDFDLF